MILLIATHPTKVGETFYQKFEVVTIEYREVEGIDIVQNYTNRGFVEQSPPDCEKKYWTIRDGQVVEMTEAEKVELHEQERQAAIQSYEQADRLRFSNRRIFGQQLVEEYAFNNYKNNQITVEQVIAQTQYGIAIDFQLRYGGLETAIALINQVPDDFLLNGTKEFFIQTIQNYLTNEPPLPPEP